MVIFHGNHADFWPSKMDKICIYILLIKYIIKNGDILVSSHIYIYYDIKSDMTDTTDMTDMTDAGLVMK